MTQYLFLFKKYNSILCDLANLKRQYEIILAGDAFGCDQFDPIDKNKVVSTWAAENRIYNEIMDQIDSIPEPESVKKWIEKLHRIGSDDYNFINQEDY